MDRINVQQRIIVDEKAYEKFREYCNKYGHTLGKFIGIQIEKFVDELDN